MKVHDSQVYRKMDVTRERISRIFELREILLSFQTGFNSINAAVVCAILESTSSLEPSFGNEVLPQDTTHLIQRPCYQRGSPCQDPAGNRTTRRPPDHRKETQTSVVWSCLQFIKSGQNHLARYCEGRKKTRKTEEEVGRRHQEMDRPGVCQVPEGSGEQGKWRKL